MHPDFEVLDEARIEALLPIGLRIEQPGCDQEIVGLLEALGRDDSDAPGRCIAAVDVSADGQDTYFSAGYCNYNEVVYRVLGTDAYPVRVSAPVAARVFF